MIVEEMLIQIRATAEGVKSGVTVAASELKKLEEQKKKLSEDIKIKFNNSGIGELQKSLTDLENQKKTLQESVRFNVDSEGVKAAKTALRAIEEEKLQLQEQIKFTADKSELERLKAEVLSLIELKKEAEKSLKLEVDASETGVATTKLKAVDEEIKKINKEILLKLNTTGLAKASSELQEVNEQLEGVKGSSEQASTSFPQIAVAATATFAAIVVAIKKGTDAYNENIATMNGLRSQMEYSGVSMAEAMDVVKEKTADGLVSESDIAASIKNLVIYGYTIDEAAKMIDRLKDSAAYNRQSQYTLGEAIKVTTEGIRNENSVLADAAGVTKNIAKMQEEYAKSLGVTAQSLTQQQKAQAVYIGTMNETEATIGNAAEYSNELAGTQAALAKSTYEMAQAFGGAMAPALKETAEILNVVVVETAKFIKENESLVRGVTLGVGIYSGLITVVSAVKAAKQALAISTKVLAAAEGEAAVTTGVLNGAMKGLLLNPVVLGLTALLTVVAYVATETKKYNDEQLKLNETIDDYTKLMATAGTADNANQYEQNTESAKNFRIELEKLGRAKENQTATSDMVQPYQAQGNYSTIQWYKENQEALSLLGISVKDTNGLYKEQSDVLKEVMAAQEQNKQKLKEANAEIERKNKLQTETIKDSKKEIEAYNRLEDAYKKVAKGGKMSRDEMLNLIETYPQLAKWIANTVDWEDKFAGKLEEVTKAERQKAVETIQSENAKTSIVIAMTKARIAAIQLEISALSLLGGLTSGLTDKLKEDLGVTEKGLEDAQSKLADGEAQIKVLQSSLDGLGDGSDGGGGSKEKEKTKEEILQEQYDADRKLYENKKALTELSIREEIAALETLKSKNLGYSDGVLEIDTQLYDLRRENANEWFEAEMSAIEKMNKGRDDKTDYSAITNALKVAKDKTIEIFKDYPLRMKEIETELDDAILTAEQSRADKILAINSKAVDELIKDQERRIQVEKLKSGTIINGEEYKYGAADEAKGYASIIAENERYIAKLSANEANLTDAEFNELQKRLADRKTYAQKVEDLQITAVKEKQAAEKKATEDLEKEIETRKKLEEQANKDKITAAQKVNKEYIDEIKSRFTEEIKIAEESANEEIAIYQNKIKEIDDLLKSETRADTDTEQQDRIRRLQEQRAYEKDDFNIYELDKQINSEQTDFDKRKRRETLEDQKAALQEQINAVKDNLNTQKAAMQEKRDEEIRLSEESLASFVAQLENEALLFAAKEKNDTVVVKNEIDVRKTENQKFLQTKEKQLEQNTREERRIANDGTSLIISDLYSRISEFAEAGAAAGRAWAEAFAASQQSNQSSSYSGISSYASNLAPMAASQVYNYEITFDQTITAPTATPSRVAAETKSVLENLTRF